MIKIRPIPAGSIERNYLTPQPQLLVEQTGYIGQLIGTIGPKYDDFEGQWTGHWPWPVKKSFLEDFRTVIGYLRSEGNPLYSKAAAAAYCFQYQAAYCRSSPIEEYGFRVDTDSYSYLVQLMYPLTQKIPVNNFQVNVYFKDRLCIHLRDAREGIPFLDPVTGKEIFRVQDGDHIQLESFFEGGKTTMLVRYCSTLVSTSLEHHAYVGGMVKSYKEFAECFHTNGNQVIPIRKSLPKRCFAYREVDGTLMEITRGERIMQLSPLSTGRKSENQKLADAYNANLGVTKAQVAAMVQGCSYGWEHPEADPANYDSEGNYKKKEI